MKDLTKEELLEEARKICKIEYVENIGSYFAHTKRRVYVFSIRGDLVYYYSILPPGMYEDDDYEYGHQRLYFEPFLLLLKEEMRDVSVKDLSEKEFLKKIEEYCKHYTSKTGEDSLVLKSKKVSITYKELEDE